MSKEDLNASNAGCTPCGLICGAESSGCAESGDDGGSIERTHIRLQADQPVVPVPVYQAVQKRDIYVEVPQVEVKDSIIPRVYNQSAVHDVPRMDVAYSDREVELEAERQVPRDVDVPVSMGFSPQFVPKWDVREVPRPVPKYEGEQQIIEVEVPQIEYKDKYVEKEVVVDVQEKIIPKITEVVKEVEVMQYEWKQQYQDVPVYKYVPKFDVELDCPPPLIVPYAETRYVNEEPQVSRPYCFGLSNCCEPTPAEPTVISSNQMMMPPGSARQTLGGQVVANNGSFSSSVPGAQLIHGSQSTQFMNGNLGEMFQKQFSQDYVLKGQLVGDAPKTATLQLTPGPVFPHPSPQVGAQHQARTTNTGEAPGGTKEKRQKKSLWNWLWGCEKDVQKYDKDVDVTAMGYPEGMPTDFAANFNQENGSEAAGQGHGVASESSGPEGVNELEPSVVYRGAVSKPPEYGGELDPISFRLHAIEIHQFVPLPHSEVPDFVKALPDGILSTDIAGLDRFFGQVPSGWADPDVTGIPAPMMSDILSGNTQNVALSNQLVCQLSSQFSKQGYVPGGTQDFTNRLDRKPTVN